MDTSSTSHVKELNFSPVKSPAVHDKNSASVQIASDSAASWHNNMQNWTAANNDGCIIIKNIINLKLEANFQSDEAEDDLFDDDGRVVGDAAAAMFPEGLVKQCKQLDDIIQTMENILQLMKDLTVKLSSVSDAHTVQEKSNNNRNNNNPLMLTWPGHIFHETSSKLEEMYSKELEVKHVIAQSIAHCSQKHMLMFYLTAWRHQPYVREPTSKILLQALLQETGVN